jgi:two-component system, NarL family, sensor histidine kinase UhpB
MMVSRQRADMGAVTHLPESGTLMCQGGAVRPSLFWRIFLPNAAVLMIAWAILAFSPAKVVSPNVSLLEFVAGFLGLVVIYVVNVVVLRRELAPFGRLRALMSTANPLRPGRRLPTLGDSAEVVELTEGFNSMLDRLERERRTSSTRALEAQESERLRLARELHDEIGQRMTALLLELESVSRDAGPEIGPAVEGARESARATLEELRRIARRLRPEALDDLGLRSALTNLCERLSAQADVMCVRRFDSDLPPLSSDEELAIYRVAQEALTNAVRHAQPSRIELRLVREDSGVALSVMDDGEWVRGEEGAGLTGMRERALMIGAQLEAGPVATSNGAGGGSMVRLVLPGRS